MANYEMTARTNYFKVKDEEAYKEFLGRFYGLEDIVSSEDKDLHCIIFDESLPDEDENEEEVSFLSELSKYLADGWVLVYMESGHEKHRYVTGFATAINNKGETRHISLESIYSLANELGDNVTEAAY